MSKNDDNNDRRHPKVKFKTPVRYRLSFFNENTLNRVWTVGMSRRKAMILAVAVILAVIALGATMIAFTPLRNLLPGYLRVADRQEYLEASSRIDSLLDVVSANDLYINNINAIIAGEVNADSILAMQAQPVSPENADSILQPSENETEFVRMYSEREGFSFTEPDEKADGAPSFTAPVNDAMVKRGKTRERPVFTLPEGRNAVYSIAMATVIDCYKADNGTYTVTLQHPDGFMSRYTGLSQIYYDRGGRIAQGARLGMIRDGADTSVPFTFELYRNATPLDPLLYLPF